MLTHPAAQAGSSPARSQGSPERWCEVEDAPDERDPLVSGRGFFQIHRAAATSYPVRHFLWPDGTESPRFSRGVSLLPSSSSSGACPYLAIRSCSHGTFLSRGPITYLGCRPRALSVPRRAATATATAVAAGYVLPAWRTGLASRVAVSASPTFFSGCASIVQPPEHQNKVLNEELPKFRDKEGHFGKPVAKNGCKDYNFDPAKWWGNYGTQVPTLQRMAIRILSLTSSSSGCERTWSCFEGNHTKKRNKLTSERLNQLVFVQYNNKMNGKKVKAKKNQNMDPLLGTDSNRAQGWLVEGGDEEDAEPVCGLTWKLIEEACGVEECGKLRRSARLAQMRDVSEDEFQSEEEPTNEEDIDFESDQEDVVPVVGEDEQDGENED
ncbi:uncharacterized protein LOC8086457 [Sorghum bicolor]|uniref:uncharacterized protein LOC8086457 n=1 Tax=Sorghum bicolor TaxID=4558 RepID=UPI000B4245EB|nr:uncharacterized protein LOC8086457 [Sorghum bicolor]|eukprot:XP_021319199.1 uncharacterized protein LOC8086457 [Sorghum bicolor]